MSTELKLHYYQKDLIKKLTLNAPLRFNELLIEGLESEHMNYHLKKLIEIGLVEKNDEQYVLSDYGKDFSNLMDDDMQTVEKQPKTSIVIRAVRTNERGVVEQLLCRRLRHPYYGKVGRLTGKVRFGETLAQAAARELYEETGLHAENFQIENIYRKMRHREDGTFVQDVFFYTLLITGLTGSLIKITPFQENFWVTAEELKNNDEYDLYEDFSILDHADLRDFTLTESCKIAEGF